MKSILLVLALLLLVLVAWLVLTLPLLIVHASIPAALLVSAVLTSGAVILLNVIDRQTSWARTDGHP